MITITVITYIFIICRYLIIIVNINIVDGLLLKRSIDKYRYTDEYRYRNNVQHINYVDIFRRSIKILRKKNRINSMFYR